MCYNVYVYNSYSVYVYNNTLIHVMYGNVCLYTIYVCCVSV